LWQIDGTPGPVLKGHVGGALCVAWSPDSQRIASSGIDKTVRLWDTKGTADLVLDGHLGRVPSVAWHPDGRLLAAGGANNSIVLWDTETGQREWNAIYSSEFGKGYSTPKGGATVTFTAAGQILHGDPRVIEREFFCYVEQPTGAVELMRPSQFARRIAEVAEPQQ
jgi:WD40 repeat protein